MAWLKRLASPDWWPIERKTKKFVVSPRGPYPKYYSIPLAVILRDIFKLAETGKEARSIIKRGMVFVDGKKIKDPKFGVGLLDVIQIPSLNKSWRVIPKNGLDLLEIDESDANKKICKIINKKVLKGNKTQLNLFGGKNIITDGDYSTHDSLLLELPSLKILDHLKFEEGNLALITGGKNAGKIEKISKIEKDRVWVGDEKKFEVSKKFVTVVGKKDVVIKLE